MLYFLQSLAECFLEEGLLEHKQDALVSPSCWKHTAHLQLLHDGGLKREQESIGPTYKGTCTTSSKKPKQKDHEGNFCLNQNGFSYKLKYTTASESEAPNMSRTQRKLENPWKNYKSLPQSETPLILHGCNSSWRLICCKGLKQLQTSPATSISNLLFSNKRNVRWHQVSLKWDFSSPAPAASHLPSLPWRTCGTDQLRWSLEGHRLCYSLCRWRVCTYTQCPPCFAEKMIFIFFNLENIYVSHRNHLRRRSCNVLWRGKKQETTAGFWSNILVTETLHNWVLSFLG